MTDAFLPVARPDLRGNEALYVAQALEEGWISSTGRFLDRFERELAAYCGTRHALACANGTVALHLLLLGMGIGPGDEVIVPSFTYVASANAVAYTGARPVLVDSEPIHWNVDPERVRDAITPRTRAIMAVHLYGHPADVAALEAIGASRGIPVIEDAAEAHGAKVSGRRVGSLGLGAAFSFYGNKILSTGEGGAVVTDDDALAIRMRQLRGQGVDPSRGYWFPVRGYNYRMTNVAAAIGCAQLERIETLLEQRDRIARAYDAVLRPESARLDVQCPTAAAWAAPVNWLYSIRVPRAVRDPLSAHLKTRGIDTRPFFWPMHRLPMYRSEESFPIADELGATGLNLPTFTEMTEADVSRVTRELLGFLDRGDDA